MKADSFVVLRVFCGEKILIFARSGEAGLTLCSRRRISSHDSGWGRRIFRTASICERHAHHYEYENRKPN